MLIDNITLKEQIEKIVNLIDNDNLNREVEQSLNTVIKMNFLTTNISSQFTVVKNQWDDECQFKFTESINYVVLRNLLRHLSKGELVKYNRIICVKATIELHLTINTDTFEIPIILTLPFGLLSDYFINSIEYRGDNIIGNNIIPKRSFAQKGEMKVVDFSAFIDKVFKDFLNSLGLLNDYLPFLRC